MEGHELLITFFRGIGAEREADMYLRLFRKGPPNRFAVIEVAENISDFSLNVLAVHLAFLSALGLHPVVIHGALSSEETGRRRKVRDSERLDSALALNETITSSITLNDGKAVGLFSGVFEGPGATDFTMRIGKLNAAIRRGAIPVVAATLTDAKGKPASMIPLRRASEWAVEQLKPRKHVRIREQGGLYLKSGAMLDYVNASWDAPGLIASGSLAPTAEEELLSAAEFFAAHPTVPIQVTSANNLLRELFTRKGGGTLIRQGRELLAHADMSAISKDRLRNLIERAFGRRLARDYFTRFMRKYPVKTIFLAPDYKAVAIVRDVGGLMYLDKFAVHPAASGEGVASDLWTLLTRTHPAFFWRSSPSNPINKWYFQKASGIIKRERYFAWWRGLEEEEIRRAVELVEKIEPTLAET